MSNIVLTHKTLGTNGRLGNQLFQIASTIGMANKLQAGTAFPDWEYSKYFKNPIKQNLEPGLITHTYKEPSFHYTGFVQDEVFPVNNPHTNDFKNTYIDLNGYFQSEKYWEHCKADISNQFEFKEDVIASYFETVKGIKKTYYDYRLCSIHFRFGDYTDNPFYAQLTKNGYYERAIKHIQQKFKKNLFLLFSDDKRAADTYLRTIPDVEYIILNTPSEIHDLCFMSRCDNNIIANSSFSWWGSYLGGNKLNVIAPKEWFGPEANLNTKDLYRETMTIL
jgi:hypothetical protein